MKRPQLTTPQIRYQGEQGSTPFAEQYADKYFSERDGLAESQAIYLSGNQLPARWRQREDFVIGELGFGTGLNFLATWAAWAADAERCARLHYLAVEQSPLSIADIHRIGQHWPELSPFAQALIAQYPAFAVGHHVLRFAQHRVTLLLAWGDAETLLPEWEMGVDAWYFDGFAPSRNPELWSPKLLKFIARNTNFGGTMATFTAAGQVRRDLISVGFRIKKKPGFDGKRERMVGDFLPPSVKQAAQIMPITHEQPPRTIILGGGIAGLMLARALRQRLPQQSITLIAEDFSESSAIGEEAKGFSAASENPAAMVLPQLSSEWTARGYLHWQAYQHAQREYAKLARQWADKPAEQQWLWQGEAIRQLPPQFAEQQSSILSASLAAYQVSTSSAHLSERGIVYPQALAIDGGRMRAALRAQLQSEGVVFLSAACRDFSLDAGRLSLWQGEMPLDFPLLEHDRVVFCLGAQSLSLCAQLGLKMPLHTTYGQLQAAISEVDASVLTSDKLLSKHWYQTPRFAGKLRYLGSTFDRDVPYGAFPTSAQQIAAGEQLIQDYQRTIGQFGTFSQDNFSAFSSTPDFMSWRLHSDDRMPLLGRLPDVSMLQQLSETERNKLRSSKPYFSKMDAPDGQPLHYVFTGLGAHGFLLAPLLAESLAANILGTPQPLQRSIRRRLSPLWQWLQQQDAR